VPELRQDSRYNQDTRIITSKFSIGVDILSVIVESVPNGCVDHDVVTLMDQFEMHMRAVPGVQNIISLASVAKIVNAGWNEGSLKWRILPRNQQTMAQAVTPIDTATGLLNADGSVMPIMIFLTDHKAETLNAVTTAVKAFAAAHSSPKVKFLLASGTAGVMAATNEVVQAAQFPILIWVFGAVTALCLITFRSVRATLCIVMPLAVVSYLGYALMVFLNIGLKTSTLPVVALGVGIGVDYGIYLFARLQKALMEGEYFEDAMFVAFQRDRQFHSVHRAHPRHPASAYGFFPTSKFQADMGLLLTFMFFGEYDRRSPPPPCDGALALPAPPQARGGRAAVARVLRAVSRCGPKVPGGRGSAEPKPESRIWLGRSLALHARSEDPAKRKYLRTCLPPPVN